MTEDSRVDLKRQPRRPIVIHLKGWYPLVMMGLVMILVTVGNVFYTIHVDAKRQKSEERARAAVVAAEREADRRWCKLLIPLDDSYQSNPNVQASELGRRVAAAIHDIREETGC